MKNNCSWGGFGFARDCFFIGLMVMHKKRMQSLKGIPGIRELEVKAFRFGYSPDTITVNKGDKVRIKDRQYRHNARHKDTFIRISGNDVVELSADAEGEFEWLCNVMCGSGHRDERKAYCKRGINEMQ